MKQLRQNSPLTDSRKMPHLHRILLLPGSRLWRRFVISGNREPRNKSCPRKSAACHHAPRAPSPRRPTHRTPVPLAKRWHPTCLERTADELRALSPRLRHDPKPKAPGPHAGGVHFFAANEPSPAHPVVALRHGWHKCTVEREWSGVPPRIPGRSATPNRVPR